MLENFTHFLDAINRGLDNLVPVICLVILIVLLVVYSIRRIGRSGFGQGLYLSAIVALEEALLVVALWFFPEWMSSAVHGTISAEFFTWVLVYFTLVPFWYFMTRKHGEYRGLFAILIFLTVLLIGWLYDYWIGIALISLPLFGIYLLLIYHLSQVALPSSDPEFRIERRNKFKALFNYLIGIQYPFWVVKDNARHDIEMRISGDYFKRLGVPGLVWMRPHQVVGLSTGIEFNVVNGQGALFTKQYERPIATVDLRTQERTSEVKTITRNGIPVTVVISTSFAMDRAEGYSEYVIDRRIGSFPYSAERVKSALKTVGVRAVSQDADPTIHWDEWVVKQVEHAVRLVISERDLNELWRPRNDNLGASASQEISDQLRVILEERLKTSGVCLFGASIVNFKLEEKDEVARQQIETWKNIWSQRVNATLADTDAPTNEEIDYAHAYAKSSLLDAIAEQIKQDIDPANPTLSRQAIAMNYLHALEDYARQQPNSDEAAKRVQSIKESLS